MNTSPIQRQIPYAEDAFHATDTAYGRLPAGWKERTDTFGAQGLKNANARHVESPDGTQFLAFRGTRLTRVSDLWNDVKQPVGGASQYAAADELGRHVRDRKLDVAFAGHSLGGGLAERETAGSRVLVLRTNENVGLAGNKREAFTSSMPRFALTIFPIYRVLAAFSRNSNARRTLLAISSVLKALSTASFVTWRWIA